MESHLLRVNEFCERYSVSRATLYRLVQRGDLTIYKIGTASRIKAAEAETWLAGLSRDTSA